MRFIFTSVNNQMLRKNKMEPLRDGYKNEASAKNSHIQY